MTRYRIETIQGRHLVCGGLIPDIFVQAKQLWASADGSNRTVTVVRAWNDLVEYSWTENGEIKLHTKLNFSFQCRYCLVVDEPKIPDFLL